MQMTSSVAAAQLSVCSVKATTANGLLTKLLAGGEIKKEL